MKDSEQEKPPPGQIAGGCGVMLLVIFVVGLFVFGGGGSDDPEDQTTLREQGITAPPIENPRDVFYLATDEDAVAIYETITAGRESLNAGAAAGDEASEIARLVDRIEERADEYRADEGREGRAFDAAELVQAARAGVTALENGETYAATAAVSDVQDARSVLLDWRTAEARRALDQRP